MSYFRLAARSLGRGRADLGDCGRHGTGGGGFIGYLILKTNCARNNYYNTKIHDGEKVYRRLAGPRKPAGRGAVVWAPVRNRLGGSMWLPVAISNE